MNFGKFFKHAQKVKNTRKKKGKNKGQLKKDPSGSIKSDARGAYFMRAKKGDAPSSSTWSLGG